MNLHKVHLKLDKQPLLLTVFLSLSFNGFAQVPDKDKVIAGAERAFEKAAKTNAGPAPGCAVGVSLNGQSVFAKAFGLAEMEHSIPNTPQTIFESGSSQSSLPQRLLSCFSRTERSSWTMMYGSTFLNFLFTTSR